jgi:hypothetical protein
LRWEQQFRCERVKQSFPVSTRRMDPKIAGVFIANDQGAELVSGGSTAAARITGSHPATGTDRRSRTAVTTSPPETRQADDHR